MMRALTIAAIAAGALACSDMPSQPPPNDALITGTWQWHFSGGNGPGGPGTVTLHLSASGGAITGNGDSNWAASDAPLTISGAVVGNEVDLAITYDRGPTIPFHGHLILRRILSGVEQFEPGHDESITYKRVD